MTAPAGTRVLAPHEAPDPLPRAVGELDHRVVPQALERVRDKDILARQADLAQQRVEQSAGLAHERQALLVLVGARGLADEHQVGIGVPGAEDHGLAGRGELRAVRARLRLPPDGLELLAALGGGSHRLPTLIESTAD
jgi:hypothetical protein